MEKEEKIVFTSSGFLGFGDDNPSELLHIYSEEEFINENRSRKLKDILSEEE